jgi:hypothetical protein
VKTTLEMPDLIFRQAKAKAAEQGIPLRQFVTEAVENELRARPAAGQRPWVRLAGRLRHLRKETGRIQQLIEREFESIEPEEWA